MNLQILSDIIAVAWLGRKVEALGDAHSYGILGGTGNSEVVDALQAARAELEAVGRAWGLYLNPCAIGAAVRHHNAMAF